MLLTGTVVQDAESVVEDGAVVTVDRDTVHREAREVLPALADRAHRKHS